jgi:hypothetical protein
MSYANFCRACSIDFASLSAFDKHRTGVHESSWSLEHPGGRRCLIGDELLGAGMELDPKGRWRIALTDEKRAELAALSAPYEQNSPRRTHCERLSDVRLI